MDANKIISLILGFLVVILLLVWVNNRFKAQRASTTQAKISVTPTRKPSITPTGTKGDGWTIFSFLRKSTPTPTVTPTSSIAKRTVTLPPEQARVTTAPQQTNNGTTKGGNTVYNQTNQTVPPMTQIPNTGVSAIFIPSLMSSLAFGVYLSKTRRRS